MEGKKKRYDWLDYGRVIMNFLMVLGHTPIPLAVNAFIATVRMPFFFFFSGFLFSFEKDNNYKTFLKRKAFQLIIPYIFFNAITYVFWVFFDRHYGNDSIVLLDATTPLPGILQFRYGINCIPIWFLIALFTVENLFYLIGKRVKNVYFILIISIILSYADHKLKLPGLPFMLNSAFTGLFFYSIGFILKDKIKWLAAQKNSTLLLLLLVFIPIWAYFGHINGRIYIYKCIYNNYLYFIISSLSGIICTTIITVFIERRFHQKNWIVFLSTNLLAIVALHWTTGKFVKAFSYFILKQPLEIYNNKIFINILFSIASIILILPAIYILNRYFPYLVGKKRKTNKQINS